MGRKPFLFLELDSHVADAGLETRIEAFLDIIDNYRELERREAKVTVPAAPAFVPARFDQERQVFINSQGKASDLRDPRINIVIPSMGKMGNQAAVAAFRSAGV